jgi:hypothetical protein
LKKEMFALLCHFKIKKPLLPKSIPVPNILNLKCLMKHHIIVGAPSASKHTSMQVMLTGTLNKPQISASELYISTLWLKLSMKVKQICFRRKVLNIVMYS